MLISRMVSYLETNSLCFFIANLKYISKIVFVFLTLADISLTDVVYSFVLLLRLYIGVELSADEIAAY